MKIPDRRPDRSVTWTALDDKRVLRPEGENSPRDQFDQPPIAVSNRTASPALVSGLLRLGPRPRNGKSYLFLTPQTDAASGGVMRAVYSLTGGAVASETRLEGTMAMAMALTQVAVVVDAAAGKLLLYVDGAKTGEQTFAGSLGSINDVNAWLGRSQYNVDPELSGTFHDFRIYTAALSPPQIATSFAGGPDPAFLSK